MRGFMIDAQSAIGFLVSQVSIIEPTVYETQYPDIQYPNLIPVDNAGNEWAKSITFFSSDKVGQADWFHHTATDMRLADVTHSKFEVGVEMAGIGYRYTLEELGQAMMVPNMNLTADRANAARRASEEFIEGVAFMGDTNKGWTGLLNDATITRVDAAATGTSSSRLWVNKTADQIIQDVNDALTGVYTSSLTVEMADTLLLPVSQFTLLATKRIDATTMTVLEFLQKFNTYTAATGQPLTIRAVRQLSTAGTSGVARMVAYRRDPSVLKMHMPMPHKFLPVWQRSPLVFDVPGIFRLGGLEIRRPGAMRYVDGI